MCRRMCMDAEEPKAWTVSLTILSQLQVHPSKLLFSDAGAWTLQTTFLLCQLTPFQLPPITGLEGWRKEKGHALFVHVTLALELHPSSSSSCQYPGFYGIISSRSSKRISTRRPAPLSRGLSLAPCSCFFKLLGSRNPSLPPLLCQPSKEWLLSAAITSMRLQRSLFAFLVSPGVFSAFSLLHSLC